MSQGSSKTGWFGGCAIGCGAGLLIAVIAAGVALLVGGVGAGSAAWLLLTGPETAIVASDPVVVGEPGLPPEAVPAHPEPAHPEPAHPEPAHPEPAQPEPAKPEPAKPELARTEPAKPESARPVKPVEPPPEPVVAPAPEVAAKGPVTFQGAASVVLLEGETRHRLPGSVPAGRYTIEATFPGEAPVVAGTAKISENGGEVIACNVKMGICRVR